MTHIMVDIETLGTRSSAVVLSIGACKFELTGDGKVDTYESFGNGGKTFLAYLQIDDQLKAGRTVDGSTVLWWFQQSEEARKYIYSKEDVLTYPGHALVEFNAFARDCKTIWGNGFDMPVIRDLFHTYGLKFDVKYSRDRDYRTVKNLPHKLRQPELIRYGCHHNALDDSITQAIHLQKVFKVLNGEEVHAIVGQ